MSQIIGRKLEMQKLLRILRSNEPEFVAIYGRRRVGKTHLIREFCGDKGLYFELTGVRDAPLVDQLNTFSKRFSEAFLDGVLIGRLSSWGQAFDLLAEEIKRLHRSKRVILFFDELPWLSSRKSGFIQALDAFWNQVVEKRKKTKVIVCGSAASWMLDHLINAKGGLHNRLTQVIALHPFSLAETAEFLASRGLRLKPRQVLELYMVMGGIPHYLKQVEKGMTPAQIVDSLCFSREGLLVDEFSRLFRALFDDAELNMQIVRRISQKRYGISRTELLKGLKISSGGTFDKRMRELTASGLVRAYLPFGQKKRGVLYRLADEYITFYLRWIEPMKNLLGHSKAIWERKVKEPSWASWAGYAFEEVCFKHLPQIEKALGFSKISATAHTWHHNPKNPDENGAQVDLLFNRDDGAITLCEIKYNQTPYRIDKTYARQLLNKLDVFEQTTKTDKQLLLSFITSSGLKKNAWSDDLVDGTVAISDLYKE